MKLPISIVVMLTFIVTFTAQQIRVKDAQWEAWNATNSLRMEQEGSKILSDTLIATCEKLEESRALVRLFTGGKPVSLTAYNALSWQTDDTPDITASNKKIYDGVVALSREQLVYYGHDGPAEWGDTVLVVMPLIVEDTMAKRHSDWADVYTESFPTAVAFGLKKGHIYHGTYSDLGIRSSACLVR